VPNLFLVNIQAVNYVETTAATSTWTCHSSL